MTRQGLGSGGRFLATGLTCRFLQEALRLPQSPAAAPIPCWLPDAQLSPGWSFVLFTINKAVVPHLHHLNMQSWDGCSLLRGWHPYLGLTLGDSWWNHLWQAIPSARMAHSITNFIASLLFFNWQNLCHIYTQHDVLLYTNIVELLKPDHYIYITSNSFDVCGENTWNLSRALKCAVWHY